MTQKQLEIGLKSGTIIYAPIKEHEENEDETIIANIIYADYFVQLSNCMDVDKDYYIRKDCIEYLTINREPNKKSLVE